MGVRYSACAATEPKSARALELLELALDSSNYDRGAALEFLAAARGERGDSWADRNAAVLLLENQLLRLPQEELEEIDLYLVDLGFKAERGLDRQVRSSVRQEGFTRIDLCGFVRELYAKMGRLDRAHGPIFEGSSDSAAWTYFLRVALEAPKLTLARYIFTPQDVVREVVARLRVGKGIENTLSRFGQTQAARWASVPIDGPAFEARIVELLCSERKTYWVGDRCGSELNELVEYPLTSAAVVIKLPGSDLEIEIKRAGIRGEPGLINVITKRNGTYAPTSHRLFGGSLGWLAQRETVAAGLFSRIYRLVHGTEAPCSRTVQNNSIVTLPSSDGETHLLDYLTDESSFGTGFEAAREAMRTCVDAFPSDTGVARAFYGGAPGQTLQFIAQALPQQAIIAGSSSFRLDRILLYLSDSGPEHYFQEGLRREFTETDARWLADTVMEEVLGEVQVPLNGFVDYASYLRDTFLISTNRRRGDENFLSAMRQIGTCWGTLLAVRGFTDGESFVLRNVGLRSIWKDGAWQIRVIFMDHDDLTVAGSRYSHLWPWREASGMQFDSIHILGGQMGEDWIPGDFGALKQIYRVTAETAESGMAGLKEAARSAYNKTQSELAVNNALRELFNARFLEGYRDFDELVPDYLSADMREIEAWKQQAAANLRTRGYEDDLVDEYIRAVVHFRGFFERAAFLYSR